MAKLIFYAALFLISAQFYGQNVDSLKQVIISSEDSKAKYDAYKAITNYSLQKDSTMFRRYLREGFAYAREVNDTETEFQLAFIKCKSLNAAANPFYSRLIAPYPVSHNFLL